MTISETKTNQIIGRARAHYGALIERGDGGFYWAWVGAVIDDLGGDEWHGPFGTAGDAEFDAARAHMAERAATEE